MDRRAVLRAGAVTGGGLLMEIFLGSCTGERGGPAPAATAEQEELSLANVWLYVTRERIRFIVGSAEMGQGVMTGLATMVSEELDLDPRKLSLELAPGDPRFHEPGLPIQITGGSESMKRYSDPLRKAGARVRLQLMRAAANRWGTSATRLSTDDGRVLHPDGRSLRYEELADEAALLPTPAAPALKAPDRYKWIGKPMRRLDAESKVFGTGVFGMDVHIPDLRTAVVVRSPVLGGRVRTYDDSAARAMPGVEDVVNLGHGVAVVAQGYWQAQNAARTINATWDEGPLSGVSSSDIRARFQADLDGGRGLIARGGSRQLLSRIRAAAARRSGTYGMPYLAHAPMEPMNCTARITSDSCEIWVGSQVPGIAQKIGRDISQLPLSQVKVHSTLLGGGFGRRSRSDFVTEAVTLAKITRKPIKVVWSREDDMRYGIFRPCALHQIEGAVSPSGELIGIAHKVACQSVYANMAPEIADAMFPALGSLNGLITGLFGKFVDPTSVEGSADTEYAIPDFQVEYFPQSLEIPVGSWRSVGHSFNAYVMETFIDELAEAGGRDPLELRRALLPPRSRLRAVLDRVAAAAGWGQPLGNGVFRGVACNKSFGSYVAAVAEVEVQGESIIPRRVVIGIDCGEIVNPDIVRMQLEGATVFGLSAALKSEITLVEGRVLQSNFHDYEVLRMFEAPKVETVLVPSAAPPTGVGEPGVPVIGPAVANAVAAATGRRLRELPLRLSTRSDP